MDRALEALQAEREQLLARLRVQTVPEPPRSSPGEASKDARSAPGRQVGVLSGASAQLLLAAVGVALLVVAAVVFAAVTWQDLGVWPRALILVSVTAAAAMTARALTQRGLRATGEAVAVLTVALVLVCVHGAHAFGLLGLGAVSPTLYVAVTYAGVVVGAHGLAGWSGARAPRLLAGGLATVPGPAVVLHVRDVLAPGTMTVEAVGFLAAAAITLAYARVLARPRAAWSVATAGALIMWGWSVVAALVVTAEVSVALGATLSLAVAAAGAATTRFGGAWVGIGSAGAGLASTAGAVAALWASGVHAPLAAALVTAVAAAALLPAHRARTGVLFGLVPVALIAAGGLTELVAVLAEEFGGVLHAPWSGTVTSGVEWRDVAVAALSTVAAGGVLGMYRRRVGAWAVGLGGLGLAAASAVQAGGLSPLVQVTLGVGAAASLATLAAWRGGRPLLVGAAGAASWALVWALTGRWTTVSVLALLAAVAAVPATREAVNRRERLLAAAVAAAFLLSLAPTAVAAAGGSGVASGFAAIVGACALVLAVDRAVGKRRGDLLIGVEIAGASAAAIGLMLAGGDLAWLAAGLAVAGVTAGAHALREDRRWSSLLSAGLLSACSWAVLTDARIEIVEAYTAVPAAAALLIGGWRLVTDPRTRSWPVLGPGLALALGPTTVRILADPWDLARVLALVAAAAVVAVAGARLRLATAVIYGVAALTLAAATQFGVAASHLPRWVTFAVVGVALVAFSATYERQLRRLTSARHHLAALR